MGSPHPALRQALSPRASCQEGWGRAGRDGARGQRAPGCLAGRLTACGFRSLHGWRGKEATHVARVSSAPRHRGRRPGPPFLPTRGGSSRARRWLHSPRHPPLPPLPLCREREREAGLKREPPAPALTEPPAPSCATSQSPLLRGSLPWAALPWATPRSHRWPRTRERGEKYRLGSELGSGQPRSPREGSDSHLAGPARRAHSPA